MHSQRLALISLLFLGQILLTPAFPVAAQEILFVTPTRIELSDEKPVQTVNITNQSDISRAYVISIVDVLMTETGSTVVVEHFDYSAKRMLRFVPRRFVLEPKKSQTIRIMARPRPNLPEGQYHSHLRFLEDVSKRGEGDKGKKSIARGAAISVDISYEALIPIIMSHGRVESEIIMKGARLEKSSRPGYVELLLDFDRKGNGQGRGYLDIELEEPGNPDPTQLSRHTINAYREVDTLHRSISIEVPEDASTDARLRLSFFETRDKDASPVKEVTLDLPE